MGILHELDISNPNKVIFPNINSTKMDLINYYDKISDVILKYLKDRPITMQRFPNGIEEDGFYMKDTPDYFPEWIDTVTAEKKEGGEYKLVICQSKDTLKYLANQACITPHIWLSTKDDLNKPDKMIFDLDPPADEFESVKQAALALKKAIEYYELTPFVMTTGSSGLHVVVPIKPEFSFDDVRDVAEKISKQIVEKSPDKYTLEQRKEKRGNKVFLDTLRNAYGQTSVSPYALRVIEDAPVATPLSWKELKESPLDPRKYTIKNIFKRLGQIEDPWKSFNGSKNSISHLV